MKKIFIVLVLLLVISGCGEKKEEKKNTEFSYDSLTYFKKIDDNLRIYTIFENTSDVKGRIENLVYGAIDYDEKFISNEHKKVNIELEPGEQRLVIVDLNIGDKIAKSVFNTPFDNNREELKQVDSTKKEGKDITDLVSSHDFYEDDEAHFNIKLSKTVEGKKLKFMISSVNNSIPLCLAYTDVKESKRSYDFDCEYKIGEAEFIYELFVD